MCGEDIQNLIVNEDYVSIIIRLRKKGILFSRGYFDLEASKLLWVSRFVVGTSSVRLCIVIHMADSQQL